MRGWPICIVCAGALLPAQARAAGAAPESAGPASSVAPATSIRGEGYLGYLGKDLSGSLGADGLVRYQLLEGGAFCHFIAVRQGQLVGCGGLLGGSLRTGQFGFDLLGEFGGRSWSNVGSSFLSFDGDPGGAASLWFAGARAGASMFFGTFALGVWVGVEDDLGRKHVTYTYQPTQWFGAAPPPTTGEADVGAATFFAALRLGAQFDL